MTTGGYRKHLQWHEDTSLQSLQFEGTTSLTLPKSNGIHKNLMALCAQLEASRL